MFFIVNAYEFQCEDVTLLGNCNEDGKLCSFGANLIFKNNVTLGKGKDCVFFGKGFEDCNDASVEFNNESFNLTKYFLILLNIIVILFLIYKNKDKFKTKQIPKIEQQLKDFIEKAKKQGQNKEEIKRELLQAKWPKDLIDKYL